MSAERDPAGEERRKLVRKARLYSLGFLAAAVLVAVGGTALIAWLLTATGLPFLETWIALAVLVLAAPVIGRAVGLGQDDRE